ncbi:DUF6220 domain-containing protein [Microtetraspora sp. NBRC 16547]|uniref:DUF6220 domain-containing protein n=1 Tax=Microtetraspora sp. NBRC 16547 TaxID=3030993 RepID=UPI0024A03578|nr:DUF6220 domain-containing protein [Microtetraspora sp. NBRC 16547]GLW99627.1 hypothetical protein Misp02_37140 [Microtetraspora sp. NBRC 16547]
MRRVYVVLAGLQLLAVLAQFYFAGVGAFDKPQSGDSYAMHGTIGMMAIPVLSLLATVVATLAKAPGRLIGLSITPLGLVVVQMLIIILGRALDDATGDTTTASLAVLGLHAVNGLGVMAVAGRVLAGARRLASTSETAPKNATAPVS